MINVKNKKSLHLYPLVFLKTLHSEILNRKKQKALGRVIYPSVAPRLGNSQV